ncbi:MAG: PspC domain-containing protein [Chloroflexi bacterium]|nr:PspC domain-containing protein [Chloroflexota bacterium]
MKSTLYRSESDRMLGGVCGGLSNYLAVDSTLVRLFFALLFFGTGIGVLAYLALWIIMPEEGSAHVGKGFEENIKDSAQNFGVRAKNIGEEFGEAIRAPHPKSGVIIGIALIALGSVLFIENLGIPWMGWFSFDVLWPLLLIIGGGTILLRRAEGV